MSGVRVLVGTRQGAFILTSDGRRERWDISGPHFAGVLNHIIHHRAILCVYLPPERHPGPRACTAPPGTNDGEAAGRTAAARRGARRGASRESQARR